MLVLHEEREVVFLTIFIVVPAEIHISKAYSSKVKTGMKGEMLILTTDQETSFHRTKTIVGDQFERSTQNAFLVIIVGRLTHCLYCIDNRLPVSIINMVTFIVGGRTFGFHIIMIHLIFMDGVPVAIKRGIERDPAQLT